MKIDFDPTKSTKNFEQRGFAFDAVVEFEWESAILHEDIRKNYPERRFIAVGLLNGRIHIICFTPIIEGIRVISLRKANKREISAYESVINK